MQTTNRDKLHFLSLLAFAASSISMPGSASELVAIKPGLMCASPTALARLTLPDGSSKTSRLNPSPADTDTKREGQCVDIAIGTRVVVSESHKNTSVVRLGPRTYIVPNIDFRPLDAPVKAAYTINQVVTAPGGRTNYYIKTLGGGTGTDEPNMIIQTTYDLNSRSDILLTSRPADDVKQNLEGFKNLLLSPDGKTLYFQTDAWATSNAVHAINIATKRVSFVAPGEIACVILAGQYQGDLVIEQHRYFVQGGSYDNLWLFSPSGKEVGLVSESTDKKGICPVLGD
jgi:hypothetical protein